MLWGGFYKYKKKEFVELYGNAMVFPSRIIKKTKKVLKDVEDCLVLKDYWNLGRWKKKVYLFYIWFIFILQINKYI